MIERISCEEVARQLGTSHPAVKAGIKNGTLPIGFVAQGRGSKEHVVILKARFDAWISAQDFKPGQANAGTAAEQREFKEKGNVNKITCAIVAKHICSSPPIVKAMLQSGRYGWGCVVKGRKTKDRIIIHPQPYIEWLKVYYPERHRMFFED